MTEATPPKGLLITREHAGASAARHTRQPVVDARGALPARLPHLACGAHARSIRHDRLLHEDLHRAGLPVYGLVHQASMITSWMRLASRL